jgi:hypothetical protein
MTFKKITTSAAVIASLVATSLSPLAATAASAHGKGGYGNYDRGYGYTRHYDGPRHSYRYDGGPRHRYAYKRHRHRGNDVAKGLAIGLGVLAVGSIIAHSR